MDTMMPDLNPDQALSILGEVAKLDPRLFDLAVANFNNTSLVDLVRSQTDTLQQLQEELAELKGEPEQSVDESAELEADDNEGD